MGYDLHITRAKFHCDNAGRWITAEEWLRYVDADPELKLAGYNGDYFALWSGKSIYPDAWLDWFDGNVFTKNPNDALMDKMVEIAKKLNAKVQGDDGEVYIGGGSKNFLPPPGPDVPSPMKSPPAMIDGARVLWWADTAGIAKTGACIFREGGRVQDSFAALAISRYDGASGCYLFLCNEQWETQNDTDHETEAEARAFAEALYPGISNRWRPVDSGI